MLLNVIFNLALMPVFGMKGAAIATMVSEFATILLKLFFSSKTLKIQFKEIVPWSGLLKIIVLNVAFGVVAYALFSVLKDNLGVYAGAVVSGGIVLALYLCVVFKPFKNLWKEFNSF